MGPRLGDGLKQRDPLTRSDVPRRGAVAGIYGGAWSGPVLVLTHHPEQLASDAAVEAVSELETALARAEELAGGRAVSIFGADVARHVRVLGWLDEIIVQIVPVVLGDGVRLFGEAPAPQATLERTYVGTSGTLTDVRFRVRRPRCSSPRCAREARAGRHRPAARASSSRATWSLLSSLVTSAESQASCL